MSPVVTMKKAVNSIGLIKSQNIYTGNPDATPELAWLVIFPNGDSDEVRHSTRQEAYNSLCNCDDIIEAARKDFCEEGWKQDERDIENHIIENINDLADECGYRVINVFATKPSVLGAVLLVTSVMGCNACGPASAPGNALIIGDSISIGYTEPVKQTLNTKGWNVRRIDDNARSTAYTLEHLDRWLAQNPDNKVITWNNGIWDCIEQNSATDDPRYRTTPEQYAANVALIGKKLRDTGARVIFITTTEIQTGTGCEVGRNEIARSILIPLGVEVRDLYQFTSGQVDWHGRGEIKNPTDVHYINSANRIIGKFIADAIGGVSK